jgi:hypothetical protein
LDYKHLRRGIRPVASSRMTTALVSLLLLLQVSTAPTTAPTTEADLRRLVMELRRQIVELKAENATLRDKAGKYDALTAVPPAAASTWYSRAEKANGDGPFPDASRKEREARLAKAKELDAKIAKLAAAESLRPELTAALYEGRVIPGLPLEGLKLIGGFYQTYESEKVIHGRFSVHKGTQVDNEIYEVSIDKATGRVTSVGVGQPY